MKRLAMTLAAGVALATAAPAFAASTCTPAGCIAVQKPCRGEGSADACPICIDWERPFDGVVCTP